MDEPFTWCGVRLGRHEILAGDGQRIEGPQNAGTDLHLWARNDKGKKPHSTKGRLNGAPLRVTDYQSAFVPLAGRGRPPSIPATFANRSARATLFPQNIFLPISVLLSTVGLFPEQASIRTKAAAVIANSILPIYNPSASLAGPILCLESFCVTRHQKLSDIRSRE